MYYIIMMPMEIFLYLVLHWNISAELQLALNIDALISGHPFQTWLWVITSIIAFQHEHEKQGHQGFITIVNLNNNNIDIDYIHWHKKQPILIISDITI